MSANGELRMQRETIEQIVFLIIFIPVSFGIFLFLLAHPLGEGSVETYHINIIYQDHQDNYEGEKAVTSVSNIFEGMPIVIKFYNLNPNKTYILLDGRNQSRKLIWFSGKDEFCYVMSVDPGDSFFLASDNRDLIWIEIENK